jgi:uncharacterized protein YecE (DUF72 family)
MENVQQEGKQHILVGTSGYDYPEWKGVFYPKELKRTMFLDFYAQNFSAVELNYTYYKMPGEKSIRDLAAKTQSPILFSIKAHKSLTHEITARWKDDAVCFKNALRPLLEKDCLTSVLFQFPQSFHYTEENRVYLDMLIKELAPLPVIVEFRHKDWMIDRVYEGLDKRHIGICIVDMPELYHLPGFHPVVTGNTAYLRFHGRNAQSWYSASGQNGSSRYCYLYSAKELESTVPVVKYLKTKARLVQIFFNNHPGGAAAVNAKKLKELLV